MEYCGDVKVRPTEDGGAIEFIGGQPIMDSGLSTAVYMSLYSNKGWWGDPSLGSTLEALESRPLTPATRLDAAEAVRQALAWMIESGIAASIDVEATIPGIGILALIIRITEPDKSVTELRYRIDWLAMKEAF